MTPSDIAALRGTIAGLLAACPELDDDDALRADMLEGCTTFNDVVARLIQAMRDADAQLDACRGLQRTYAERTKAADARRDRVRGLIETLMGDAKLSKVVTPVGTASLGMSAASPVVTDEAALPEPFWRVRREPNMTAIRDALKDGLPVPGVTMNNGAPRLTIR